MGTNQGSSSPSSSYKRDISTAPKSGAPALNECVVPGKGLFEGDIWKEIGSAPGYDHYRVILARPDATSMELLAAKEIHLVAENFKAPGVIAYISSHVLPGILMEAQHIPGRWKFVAERSMEMIEDLSRHADHAKRSEFIKLPTLDHEFARLLKRDPMREDVLACMGLIELDHMMRSLSGGGSYNNSFGPLATAAHHVKAKLINLLPEEVTHHLVGKVSEALLNKFRGQVELTSIINEANSTLREVVEHTASKQASTVKKALESGCERVFLRTEKIFIGGFIRNNYQERTERAIQAASIISDNIQSALYTEWRYARHDAIRGLVRPT